MLQVLLFLLCCSAKAFIPSPCFRRSAVGILPMVSTEPSSSTTTLPETSPLPPHTFAGLVEQGLRQKFKENEQDIQRVLTSWRLVEMGYEHREYVGPADKSPEESKCHQHAPSYVPGLTAREFWDLEEFPWAKPLQSKYKEIKEEFTRVAMNNADKLQREGNNIWAGALTEDASSYGMGWKTLGEPIVNLVIHKSS